jgi:hypothetical protein
MSNSDLRSPRLSQNLSGRQHEERVGEMLRDRYQAALNQIKQFV